MDFLRWLLSLIWDRRKDRPTWADVLAHAEANHPHVRHSARHHQFRLRPVFVCIYFTRQERYHVSKQIEVGQSATAKVVVLDQFGNAFPGFDFAANPPAWSVDQPDTLSLAAGASPDAEVVSGVAATTSDALLLVSIPGLGSASTAISVVAPPPPVPVATSLEIQFE